MTVPKEQAISSKDTLHFRINNSDLSNKYQLGKGDKSHAEFLQELLDAYDVVTGKSFSISDEKHFPNSGTGKEEKEEKGEILKEIFELDKDDPVAMSEVDLLKKASELSGKSIKELCVEGAILTAKNIIGREVQRIQGKGLLGQSDDKLAQTYDILKQSGQKISLNKIVVLSGCNRKTVEHWIEKNNITFE